MTLVELKKSLHEKIDGLNDPDFLEMMNDIIVHKDIIFQIPEEHIAGIEQGIQDIKNGDFLTQENFERRYEKWLKD